jgi:hypothetical protein
MWRQSGRWRGSSRPTYNHKVETLASHPKGGLGELLAAYEAAQAAEVAEGSTSTDAAGAQLAAQQKDASMLVQKAAGTVRPPTGQFGHGIRAGNTFL